jgi:hypothetical protein
LGYVLDSSDCDDADPLELPGQTWYEDFDNDTFGNPSVSLVQCTQPATYVLDNTDCDDTDSDEFPGQTWYEDFDTDTFGNASVSLVQCEQPPGYVLDATDCDDTDITEFPGQVWYEDFDVDTFGNASVSLAQCQQPGGYVLDATDCDDQDAGEFPGQVWYEDFDNDTFGNAAVSLVQCEQPATYVLDSTDCDDQDASAQPGQIWYADIDNDTYGDPNSPQTSCLPPANHVLDNTDCDDTNVNAFPGAVWYEDFDVDTFGNPAVSLTQCLQPTGFVADNTDCDDANSSQFPGQTWYIDFDVDNFGDPATLVVACLQPVGGMINIGLDCDDNDTSINPLATELCDGIDQDCDGVDDNGFPDFDGDFIADCVDPDADADGDPSITDCNDLEPLECGNCGFVEVCNDGFDNDCDPSTSCFDATYVDSAGNTVSLGAIDPVLTANAPGWYGYGSPNGSSSNTGLEVADKVSFGLVLDTTVGGLASFMFSDLPNDGSGGSLAVSLSGYQGASIIQMDDPGENSLSALSATTGNASLTYAWIACCNDGFVISGMDPQFCVTMDITASTGVTGIVVYDQGVAVNIPGGPGAGGALPSVTLCEAY